MTFFNNKEKKKSSAERIVSALDLPKTILPGVSDIELSGNREAVINKCDGVIEYNDDVIKISAGELIVCFYGNHLIMRALTAQQAVIAGEIVSVQFLT